MKTLFLSCIAIASLSLALAACASEDETAAPSRSRAATAAATTLCEVPGEWARSREAAWLRRAATVAGFSVQGCTGSAWIVGRRSPFSLWTSTGVPSRDRVFDRLAGVTVYGDDLRLTWRAQGISIWLEPGRAVSGRLPRRGALAWLVLTTRNLPREYRPIEMMTTPTGPLAKCRSSRLLRSACPTRIPRIPGWRTYPSYGNLVETTFGIESGAPGRRPELNRPPAMLHLEISAARGRTFGVPFGWPTGEAVQRRNGLAREERRTPIPLGEAAWGMRRGDLVLAPSFPAGGSQGSHLIFRWRRGSATYIVGLHAWEPFNETVAVLRELVESIPS